LYDDERRLTAQSKGLGGMVSRVQGKEDIKGFVLSQEGYRSESESECKCLTCNQKPTGSQFSLLHEPNKRVNGKTKNKAIEQSSIRKGGPMKSDDGERNQVPGKWPLKRCVKVDRCVDRSIFRRHITSLMFRN